MGTIETWLTESGWGAEELEPGIWRATFSTEREEDFDLYVMDGGAWIHCAVSPLVRPAPGADVARMTGVVARLNQQIRLVRLGVDDDGDVNLLADLPTDWADATRLEETLDLLVQYTDALAFELRRIVHEPGYHSAALGMP